MNIKYVKSKVIPYLQDIIYDKKEDQARSMKTYTAFFNTEPQLGTVIVGMTAGLEEAVYVFIDLA